MRQLLSCLLMVLLCWAIQTCNSPNEQNEQTQEVQKDSTSTVQASPPPAPNPYQDAEIKVETYPVEAGGFGYSIYIDGAKKIDQPHIPGMSGLEGFETAEKAQKTGEFVGSKIRRNQMPPTVSKAELDSLGVL